MSTGFAHGAVSKPPSGLWAKTQVSLPMSHANAWSSSRGRPSHMPARELKITSLRTKQAVVLSDLAGTLTIAEVGKLFARQIHLSSRKAISLRWQGSPLIDDETLDAQHIPDGATLEAVMRARTQAELQALQTIEHILLVDVTGTATVVDNVGASTTIGSIKALLKAPPTSQITFSPVFASSFGTPLADDRTLASCSVLDGDVLYFSTGEPPPPAEPPKRSEKRSIVALRFRLTLDTSFIRRRMLRRCLFLLDGGLTTVINNNRRMSAPKV